MKKILMLVGAALLVAASPSAGQSREARERELRELQADLANLDEELESLDRDEPRSDRFRERAEEIREETIYLKVKMRRHQRDGGTGTGLDRDEVADLRASIEDLREDIGAGRRRDTRAVRLDEGTEIVVRLDDALSSRTARQEDRFEASVAKPVRAAGALVIPAGTRVRGIVTNVEAARRPSKSGRLELSFDTLYVGRSQLDLRGRVVSVEQGDKDSGRRTTEEKAGLGVILGGVLGGLLGGKDLAVIGAVVGGGGAVAGTKGDDVELPAGTLVTVRLERALAVPRSTGGSRGRQERDDDAEDDGRLKKER